MDALVGMRLPIVSDEEIEVYGYLRPKSELLPKMYMEPDELERCISVGPLATLVGGMRAPLPDLSDEEHKAIDDWANESALFLEHIDDYEFMEVTLTPEEREARKTQFAILTEAAKYDKNHSPIQNLYMMQNKLLSEASEYNTSFPALGSPLTKDSSEA